MIVELSVSGINRAIKELEKEHKDIVEHHHDIVDKNIQDAADMAQRLYDNSFDNNEVGKHITVKRETHNKRNGVQNTSIIASGGSVAFKEFGAGVTAGQGYPKKFIPSKIPVYPGSWSQTKGKGMYNHNTTRRWFFNKQMYTQVRPTKALVRAFAYISRETLKKVRRDFK